ncbi:fkbp'fkbp [Cryptosporidium canis]|uniref:peptidylprolyl isomerase n=1 Tax=Cryptosporidium canis TaxID=195482 RepID=A0ABQ8P620_9CRYT|nr:fkbp'fkbp [Cryptosporidium canis]
MFKVVGFRLSTKGSDSESKFEFSQLGLTLSHITLTEGSQVSVFVKFPEDEGYLQQDLVVATVTKSQPNACIHQQEFPTGSVIYCKGSGKVDCVANLPIGGCCEEGCCEGEHSCDEESEVGSAGDRDEDMESEDLDLCSDPESVSTVPEKEAKKDGKKVIKAIEKKKMPELKSSIKAAQDSMISPGFKKEFPNGLKYEVLSISKNVRSDIPQIALNGSKVNVKYEGRLAKTGKKFDSGNLSFTVGSGQVVPGFDQGVKGMIVTETRRVFIPSKTPI